MHIVAISDLHGWLPGRVPACDLLLIAGDVCPDVPGTAMRARLDEAAVAQAEWLRERFAPWLEDVPARDVLMCWGNHDYIGERPALVPAMRARLLTDEECVVEGWRVYATPWTHLQPDVWALDIPLDQLAERMRAIPDRIDILMTHGPARGVLDRVVGGARAGSTALAEAVERVRPRLHVFGHIHEARGQQGSSYNVSVLDVQYRPYALPLTEIELAA